MQSAREVLLEEDCVFRVTEFVLQRLQIHPGAKIVQLPPFFFYHEIYQSNPSRVYSGRHLAIESVLVLFSETYQNVNHITFDTTLDLVAS